MTRKCKNSEKPSVAVVPSHHGAMTSEEASAVWAFMHKRLDQQEMQRAMFSDPAKFLGTRLCTHGAPWCRVQLRNDPPYPYVEARFLILRERLSLYVPNESRSAFASFEVDPNAKVRVRRFEDTKIAECFKFQLRGELVSDFDELFSEFCFRAKRFFGEGTFHLFEVLSNEQAWKRIKSLRDGLGPSEPDPWQNHR